MLDTPGAQQLRKLFQKTPVIQMPELERAIRERSEFFEIRAVQGSPRLWLSSSAPGHGELAPRLP